MRQRPGLITIWFAMRTAWLGLLVIVAACLPPGREATPGSVADTDAPVQTSVATATSPAEPATTATTRLATTTTTEPRFTLTGSVLAADGSPMRGATVTVGGDSHRVDSRGLFTIADVPAGELTIARPAWVSQTIEWDGSGPVDAVLEPRVVRAIRVSRYVAMSPDEFEALLDQIEDTAINTLIFDTKDETGTTLYQSQVPTAIEVGAVRNVYDPVTYIAAARERGLYTITRIVTFEDEVWTGAKPEVKLAGYWVDARNPDHWEYPIQLAEEACELGFDEIQFDYVRFPTGRAAEQAQRTHPMTEDVRVESVSTFLREARDRLHPMGCAISAAIFGIVVSSPDDQGIGQRPEEVSTVVDAVSPMVYPSHYSPGWLGYADPNDHPGPVTADALEDAGPRLAHPTLLRPWLQAFYYNGSQVKAGIFEAERRGHGWLLWNAAGNYGESWIPLPDELPKPEEDAPAEVADSAEGEATEDQIDGPDGQTSPVENVPEPTDSSSPQVDEA